MDQKAARPLRSDRIRGGPGGPSPILMLVTAVIRAVRAEGPGTGGE
jgi:hypothetical protein